MALLSAYGADHVLGSDGAGTDQSPTGLLIAWHDISFGAKLLERLNELLERSSKPSSPNQST
ncbi:MAG: hypothetical protein KGK18_12880 [Burkholderiales bacterium]|nr:hypothetical protein [Burkholderiales bacterium]